jgi:PAS domain S-box-containing protein
MIPGRVIMVSVSGENQQPSKDKDPTPFEAELSRIKHAALDSSINATLLSDLSGRIFYVNHAFYEMWRYTEKDPILSDQVEKHWSQKDEFLDMMEQTRKTGSWSGELAAKRKDGSEFHAFLSAAQVKCDNVETECILISAIDISQRKQVEKALHGNEERLRTLMENHGEGLCVLDENYRFIYANRAAGEIFGVEQSDLIGSYFDKFLDRENKAILKTRIQASQGGEKNSFDLEIARSNGDKRLLSIISNGQVDNERGFQGASIIISDDTERIRSEEALRESEQKYKALLESQGEGLCIVDETNRFIFSNPAAEELFGVTHGGLIGRYFDDFLNKKSQELLKKRKTNKKRTYDLEIKRPDGEKRQLIVTASPQPNQQGLPNNTLKIFCDVTDRKRAAEDLKQSEERFRGLSEATFEAILITDEGFCIEANSSAFRMFGFNEDVFSFDDEDLIGSRLVDLLPPESAEQIKKQLASSSDEPCESVAKRRDGSVFPVEIQSKPAHYKDRAVVVTAIRDITARKKAEERVAVLDMAINQSVDGVAIVDLEGFIQFANSAWIGMQGGGVDDPHSQRLSTFNFPDPQKTEFFSSENEEPVDFLKEAINKGTFSGEVEQTRMDGSVFPVWMTCSLVRGENEKPIGLVVIARDITERKAMEDQVNRAKNTAESASRAKSAFLANMSHELRTPLTAIKGFAQLLEDSYYGDLNENQGGFVKDISDSAAHLLSLINEILDLAKIESGKMDFVPSIVDISDLIEKSLVMVKEKCHKHQIRLTTTIADDLEDLMMEVDERKMKQVLFNLLSNASKFTPDGGEIVVEASKTSDEILIAVRDSGIGIPAEEQDKIFEEFYQATGIDGKKEPGTGLGLPVTKRLVELHRGCIWVESDGSDQGSRFCFTLPLGGSDQQDEDNTPQTAMQADVSSAVELLDYVKDMIDLHQTRSEPFTLGLFRFDPAKAPEDLETIQKTLQGQIRGSDFLLNAGDGDFYLFFPGLMSEGESLPTSRILDELTRQYDVNELNYSTAIFPKDSTEAEDLLKILAKAASETDGTGRWGVSQ